MRLLLDARSHGFRDWCLFDGAARDGRQVLRFPQPAKHGLAGLIVVLLLLGEVDRPIKLSVLQRFLVIDYLGRPRLYNRNDAGLYQRLTAKQVV